MNDHVLYSSVAWFTSILAMSILENGFGLIVAVDNSCAGAVRRNCTGFFARRFLLVFLEVTDVSRNDSRT